MLKTDFFGTTQKEMFLKDIELDVEFSEYMNDLLDYGLGKYDVDFYDNVIMAVPLKQLNFNVNPRSTIMSYFDLQKFVVYLAGSITKTPLRDFNYNGDGQIL